jgi:hypothetical protein
MQENVFLEPVAVRRGTAAKMLDCSMTTIHKLIVEGKLQTIGLRGDKRVTVASIKALASPKA